MELEPRIRALHLDDKDKDKPPKEEVNGQPTTLSPAEDEVKNGFPPLDANVMVIKQELPPHLQQLQPHLAAPHLGVTFAESVNQHFEHSTEQQLPQCVSPPPQPHHVDSANNTNVRQLFVLNKLKRSQIQIKNKEQNAS
ncbi:hypothetical protein FQR65_LT02966 [Abscondita terminalis]|nr:hypothetical protein FQR65_LT02966 [Abscondita terminalis]